MTRPGQQPYATASETLFADYLERAGLGFHYEPAFGARHLDFLVHRAGWPSVVCEVTAITKPLLPDGARVGAVDPYADLRRKIVDKHKQGRAVKGRYPYVVVVRFEVPHAPVELVVPGAMFGDIAVEVAIDVDDAISGDRRQDRLVTAGRGRLQANRNTTISAVAVLSRLNPLQRALDRAVAARTRGGQPTFEHVWRVASEEAARLGFDEQDLVPRLDVFHNPYATLPLPSRFFAGPHDAEWRDSDQGYRRSWVGDRYEPEVAEQ